jgi:hypothetical protein
MPDTVTRYGHRKFGSANAKPKIIGVYRGAGGWQLPPVTERLTRTTAEQLRSGGVTMVRVRWRFRTIEVTLRKYLSD